MATRPTHSSCVLVKNARTRGRPSRLAASCRSSAGAKVDGVSAHINHCCHRQATILLPARLKLLPDCGLRPLPGR